MEFAKFCSLLEREALFFSRPENLTDPWEGYVPLGNLNDSYYADVPDSSRESLIDWEKKTIPDLIRKQFGVNCWHASEIESEALWRNYPQRGIAIQSTFGKLKEALSTCTTHDVYVGTVKYVDHNSGVIDPGNLFNRILWKRKSFEYEKELRAVIWEAADPEGKGAKPFDERGGEYVRVDIAKLIENIYITPFEKDEWFVDVVKDLVRKYGLDLPIKKSDLMNKPF